MDLPSRCIVCTGQLISITRIRRRQRSKAELQLTKCSAIDAAFPVETVSNFPRENVSPRVILIRFDLMRPAAGGSSTVVSLEFSNFHIDTFGDLLKHHCPLGVPYSEKAVVESFSLWKKVSMSEAGCRSSSSTPVSTVPPDDGSMSHSLLPGDRPGAWCPLS